MITKFKLFENYNVSFEEDDDRIEISIYKNNEKIGYIILDIIHYGYWMFEDEIDEDSYDKLFPDDKFVKIETIKIEDNYKGNGYAKILMNKAIEYVKKLNIDVIYLNASPMGFNGLNLEDLVGFYESFGFEIFIDDYAENKEMIKYLN